MSFKPEVIADASGKWYGNALVLRILRGSRGQRPRPDDAVARRPREPASSEKR